jgi:acyl-CoA thioester hydrolase
MSEFHFYIPIDIRYGDLDPQWHVNNARYLTFLEQGRMEYLRVLGLWDGQDFFNLGLIVADIHIAYLAPVVLGQKVRLDLRVSSMGRKRIVFEYLLVDSSTEKALARAESVMVTYDYHAHTSIPVPPDWRKKISDFEGHIFNEEGVR